MAIVGLDHVQIAAPPGEEDFAPAREAHAALRVASGSLEVLAERLVEAGCEVRWDDALAGVARFYADDPWGHRLELVAAAPIALAEAPGPDLVDAVRPRRARRGRRLAPPPVSGGALYGGRGDPAQRLHGESVREEQVVRDASAAGGCRLHRRGTVPAGPH